MIRLVGRQYFLTALCMARRCLWKLPLYIERWKRIRPLRRWRTYEERGLIYPTPPVDAVECRDMPGTDKANRAVALVREAEPPGFQEPIWERLSEEQKEEVRRIWLKSLNRVFDRVASVDFSLRTRRNVQIRATIVGFRDITPREAVRLFTTCRN